MSNKSSRNFTVGDFDDEGFLYYYKFLPFNDGSLKTLSEGTMFFQSPLKFNDPFDCHPYYDLATIDDDPKRLNQLMNKAGSQIGLSPADRIRQKSVMRQNLLNSVKSGEQSRRMADSVGVSCFSANPLNLLMWAHYANDHKGFLLEIRIHISQINEGLEIEDARNLLLPLKVQYRKKRPKLSITKAVSLDDVQSVLLTKSKDWRYEKEYRVIDTKNGSGIYPYKRDKILSSVIAGLKISDRDYSELLELVNHLKPKIPSLELYRVSNIEGTFGLTVDNHPRLNVV